MDNLGLVRRLSTILTGEHANLVPEPLVIRTFTDQKIPAGRGDRRTSNFLRYDSQPLQVTELKLLIQQIQLPQKCPNENMRSNFCSLLHDRSSLTDP